MADIEFYIGDRDKHIAALTDGAVPREREVISIRGATYVVVRVTWAVDHEGRHGIRKPRRQPADG